jgi:anti-sigma regulatory factor (Ser/Thr protein kinase)
MTGPAAGSGRIGVTATEDRAWLPVAEVTTAGAVRRTAVALGTDAGMADGTLGQLAIVASEIATNLARHADRGVMQLRLRHDGGATGVEIIAMDSGPGMADLTASSRDGHSTAGTLGIGLGAIRRLAHEFDAYSLPDRGTVLVATVWQSRPHGDTGWIAGVSRPIAGEEVCGDAYAARDTGTRKQVMLCDGLGHGELASRASRAAVDAFRAAPDAAPAIVLNHVSQHIRHTRGGVAAIAELADGRIRFAGIGNVGSSIMDGSARRVMVSTPGIVGHQHRDVREFEYATVPNALVVLHSDGVGDRWRVEDYPGLLTHSPAVVAATLLRDAGYRRDDAAVLVARVR